MKPSFIRQNLPLNHSMVVFYTAGPPLTRTPAKDTRRAASRWPQPAEIFRRPVAFDASPAGRKAPIESERNPAGFLSRASLPSRTRTGFLSFQRTRGGASRRPFLLCVLGGRKHIGFGRTLCLMIRYPRIFAELCVWCEQFVNVWKKSTLFSKIQLREYVFPHPPGISPGKTGSSVLSCR